MITSFWSTAEVDAWSRGFDYSGYLDLHHMSQTKGAKLNPQSYNSLCQLLEQQMESDIGVEQ